MGTTALVKADGAVTPEVMEKVLLKGDLGTLSPAERVNYYGNVCQSLGLNPLTQPFKYIILNGKLTLYASKDCTEQLRNKHGIGVSIVSREVVEGCYVVTARATTPAGRPDESIGAVAIDGLKGEARSNGMMKAETKAKRRVTLSICGLGWTDESEVESIPGTAYVNVDTSTGEILEAIDTGGNRPGTKAAAMSVAERKIAEMKPADPPPAPYVATDADLPLELGGTGPIPPAPVLHKISEAQRRLLLAAAKDGGYTTPEGELDRDSVKRAIAKWGFASSKDITVDKFDAILRTLRGEPAAGVLA
jgi:hypothetical protein